MIGGTQKMEGTVKFFNRKKGFGFIQGDDGKDYFLHFTALPRGEFVRDNDRVSFEPAEGERGPKAMNVQVLGAGEAPAGDAPAEEAPQEEAAPVEEEPAQEEAPAEEPAEEPASEEPAEEMPTEEPASEAPQEEEPKEE